MYRDELAVINSAPDALDPKDTQRQVLRSRMQMEMCGEYFAGCKTSLEIGCSLGTLMHALAGIGVEPVGIEPDERYHVAEPARNYKVYTDISLVEPRPFDLICMSHSLEHLNHPLDYIRMLDFNYAHENTRYMIEVPNGERNIVERPHHPFGFTKFALDWLMAQVGRVPINKRFYHGLAGNFPTTYLLMIYGRQE
jgi:hypothetical protein